MRNRQRSLQDKGRRQPRQPARQHGEAAANDERRDRALVQGVVHVEAEVAQAMRADEASEIGAGDGEIGGAEQYPTAHDGKERIEPADRLWDALEDIAQAQALEHEKSAVPDAP